MGNDRYDGRRRGGHNRDTAQYGTSGNRRYNSREQDAEKQAYEEYLKLRERNKRRGGYVKDDTLYGEYFPKSAPSRSSRAASDEAARRQYLEMRAKEHNSQGAGKSQGGGRKQVAVQGRKNKADSEKMTRAEKKAAKREAKMYAKGGKKKKKSNRGLRIALLILLILVIGIGGVIAAGLTVVKNTLDNVGRIEIDSDLIGINSQVDSDLRNYRNIAILGIDARDMSSDEDVRSDAMIVVSINKETNKIKMFSVYRDTMLDIGDDVGLDKVTHAYYYGGPTKTLYTLNKNLDLNIKEVVVVNWKAVADTVDALGGLDIEIEESEIDEMNKYIEDTYNNIGGSNEKIESAGMQTLNGNQAVTYARIRKDAITGDYRRNERMKIVVMAAFEKAKQMDIAALQKISSEILPEIKTNMSSGAMMKLALKLNSFDLSSKNVGWPYDTEGWTGDAWYGVPVTLQSNVSQLHEEFFGQEDYIPTQDVQDISNNISLRTGYY